MNKKYSFDLVPPKNFKYDWIVVEAKNKKEAKQKLLVELSLLNKKMIKVHEHKVGA